MIAIDPGRTTGWAEFVHSELLVAGTCEQSSQVLVAPSTRARHDLVLIEVPRWYPHDHKDVNDLIDLAVLVGELKNHFRRELATRLTPVVELVYPRTWKGNVPKDVMTKRILDRLTSEELARVPRRPRARTPDHNCVDAIGLGLWRLGRLR